MAAMDENWKHEPTKSPSKKVENDEKIEQIRIGEFESDYPFPGKKPSGFFRNIKKRLCIKNLMSCRTKQKIKAIESSSLSYNANENLITSSTEKPVTFCQKNCMVKTLNEIISSNSNVTRCNNTQETSDEEVASWEEYTSEGNENINRTLRRDDVSGSHFDEEENLQYSTEEMDSIIELHLNKEEKNVEHFPVKTDDELESCFDDEKKYLGVTTSNVAEPQADSSKEVMEMALSDDDQKNNANEVKASLTEELLKLSKYGWYWGPISGDEADAKLVTESDGAFLVRDSSDDRYLLTLSFKSSGKLLHSRMEHSGGLFSLCTQPEGEGFTSVAALINHSMNFSQSAVFCYSRPKYPGYPSFPVRLTKPVSRFTQVRSLQYLCRFVIRQNTRLDNIHKLPLPKTIRGYIEEAHY